jgi:hypothetical protein
VLVSGFVSMERLHAARPDALFESAADTAAVLGALGIPLTDRST